MTSKVTQGHCK